MKIKLPIDEHLEKIASLLDHSSSFILKASPGSGKTTRVPIFLQSKFSGKILVLEPRRLAAKLSALRIAEELGESIKQTVGYRFRFENEVTDSTPLVFLTEGTFLKTLQGNPHLQGVSLVILDEFHERHLETDTALAYLKYLQQTKRPDLKILIMSATIETKDIEKYLENSQSYDVHLPPYEQTVHYLENRPSVLNRPIEVKVLEALQALWSHEGDFLVFLTGIKEIETVFNYLKNKLTVKHQLFQLHGQMEKSDQEKMLKPTVDKKIILSTNIAESALTIPGVRLVIDGGEQREMVFYPNSGLSFLETKKTSQASSLQRAGRSNREGPGFVYRLYSEHDFNTRAYNHKAEILRSDLSEVFLDLLSIPEVKLSGIQFLDTPPETLKDQALKLLTNLGAISNEQLSSVGKEMLSYPLSPRLARLYLESLASSQTVQNEVMQFILNQTIFHERKILQQRLKNKTAVKENKSLTFEKVILTAYLDRVMMARTSQKDFKMMTGEMAKLAHYIKEVDFKHSLWIATSLNHQGQIESLVPIEEAWLYDLEPFPIVEESIYDLDPKNNKLSVKSLEKLGSLILNENRALVQAPNKDTALIMLKLLQKAYDEWTHTDSYKRFSFYAKQMQKKLSDVHPFLEHQARALLSWSTEDQKNFIFELELYLKESLDPGMDQYAPLTIELTDRRKVPIHYETDQAPWVESYIQDFYGLKETPRIAKGAVNLKVHLLGPHKRALQVTTDLMSFWQGAYQDMFKELNRDYPRHYWPNDPTIAKPILLKKFVTTV